MKNPMRLNGEIAPFLRHRTDAFLDSSSLFEVAGGALASMERERIDAILNATFFYNGVSKTEFLDRIQRVFSEFENGGDNELNLYLGRSASEPKAKGFKFIGSRTGNFIELLIDIENGQVKDIRVCTDLTSPVHAKGRRLNFHVSTNPF